MIHLSSDTSDLFQHAYGFAQKQVRRLIEQHPQLYPIYTENGVWRHEGPAWTHWCDGFLPGILWIFAEHAEPGSADAAYWKEQAEAYTVPLESRKRDRDGHDLGFLFRPTYYRWWRMSHEPAHRDVLIEAGRTMALRFREKGHYLRSFVADNSLFVDVMMNVGLVFFAARETGDRRLRDIASKHAHTTRRFLVRGDGSTAQEGIFDTDSGEFLRETTHQGYRGDSCWSRGLTYAMYGFISCYELSNDARFLSTAEACAEYYIQNSPSDGIPPWDFNAPPQNRVLVDSSAAAIASAGMLRLAGLVQDPGRANLYKATALHILRNLCEKHLAHRTSDWEGVLRGGIYHVNKGLGVDESVMWGEYYFCEALERALW